MLYFGCKACRHFKGETITCTAFPSGIPINIISGEIHHRQPMFEQENDVVYEPKDEIKYELIIKNQDRYPNSVFFEPKDYEILGDFAGNFLIQVGYEDGDENSPLVAVATFDTEIEEVSVSSLYSMLTMNPADVHLLDYGINGRTE